MSQGPVVGPTFFNSFVNDLEPIFRVDSNMLLADETMLFSRDDILLHVTSLEFQNVIISLKAKR